MRKTEEKKAASPDMVMKIADCVTEVRIGNSVLVVSGYFKKDSKATAADKLAKVIAAEQQLLDREAV